MFDGEIAVAEDSVVVGPGRGGDVYRFVWPEVFYEFAAYAESACAGEGLDYCDMVELDRFT